MEKEKNKYELMVMLKAQLPENVRMGVESKIIETLESKDGKVVKTEVWGKKHLAYTLKLNKDILRYLVSNKEK
jgi:ribosomal protein S6